MAPGQARAHEKERRAWRGLRGVQISLGILVTVLSLAAIGASILIIKRQAALQQAARYNVAWTVSQAATEVARLQAGVGAFGLHQGRAERDAVQLWMDIVASRVPLLELGEVGDFTRGQSEHEATVRDFRSAAKAAEALVAALGQPGSAQRLNAVLSQLYPKLGRLASAAHVEGGRQTTRDLQELGRLYLGFSCLLIGLIACGFAIVGVLIWNNQLLRRAHDKVQALNADLHQASSQLTVAHEQVKTAMEEVQLQNLILRERDRDLHTQYTRFDAALNNMSQGLCMADADHRLIVCNVRFLELFGLSAALARPGVGIADLFRAVCSGSGYDAHAIERIRAEQEIWAAHHKSGTLQAECPDGRMLAVSHRAMADGGWLATYEDATERRSAEARIRFMAHHDALTGLPNRVLFRDHMDEALHRARKGAKGLALLCLDLDNFKTVNDTLGHPVGDALLEAAGQRLQGCVREGDIVARLGGDEFAIVQTLSGEPRETEALAERIIRQLKAPYELCGRRVTAGVSIGIATLVESGMSADLLLRNADMALYRAKASGRGTYCFFEAEMDAEVQERLAVEADLQQAVEQDQFEVFYQPLTNLKTDRIAGFEALLRWRHPERGLIPPAQFIPVAEELGLISAIGEWVLRRACTDAAAWPEQIKIAVNLSPMQFRGADVVQTVANALEASGLSPRRLELEITESALLQDNAGTLTMLHRLRRLGTRIALDDFGTGYSSLSYLRSFPFDKIKVDRSFVGEMNARPDCEAIVNSIAGLASKLGMTTTAEGIESADQLELVRKAGCTEGQGYHFGRPTPAFEVMATLNSAEGSLLAAA